MGTIDGGEVGEAVGGISVTGTDVAGKVVCGVIVAFCSSDTGVACGVTLTNVDTFSLAQLINRKLSNEIRMIVFIIFTLM